VGRSLISIYVSDFRVVSRKTGKNARNLAEHGDILRQTARKAFPDKLIECDQMKRVAVPPALSTDDLSAVAHF
jgi:hypothetical protein